MQLGGVAVKRSITFNTAEAYARFLDTFTNTTGAPLTIEVAFGGQLGYDTGTNQSAIASTSSGDTTLTTADKWTVSYSPSAGVGSATVNGTSATVPGTFDRTGNFLRDPFTYALRDDAATTRNHIGYVNTLTIPAGATKALVALRRDRPVGDARVAAAAPRPPRARRSRPSPRRPRRWPRRRRSATSPPRRRARWSTSTSRPSTAAPRRPTRSARSPVTRRIGATTSSPYNVVGKTITQLIADLKSGATTSAADHAGVPGPDRRLRPRPVRPELDDHARARRRWRRPRPPTPPARPATRARCSASRSSPRT